MQRAVATANQGYIAFLLAGVASCDAVDGKAEHATKLFGLSDAILEKLGRTADPADAVEYERYRARARERLGASEFAAALQTGRRLPLDSVLATIR
jgi:hypothetical protein